MEGQEWNILFLFEVIVCSCYEITQSFIRKEYLYAS
jgi:hypothetical protein